MSQTAPTPIDPLPTAPSTSDPTNFDSLADAFIAAWATFRTQMNNIATNVYNNAVDCYNNALAALGYANAAASSAAAAAASSNVVKWVSGTTYTDGAAVWSPANGQTYRRNGTGAGTTDPSLDSPHYWLMLTDAPWQTKTAAYTAAPQDRIKADTQTIGAWPLSFPASPPDGARVEVLDIMGNFHLANLTIVGNGKTVMGYDNLVLTKRHFHRVFTYDATTNNWKL
jgi:hypothetical protein